MKKAIYVSTECYPAAKAGGMADVVGALPKYLPAHGWEADVIIPRYDLPWINGQKLQQEHSGKVKLESWTEAYDILKIDGVLPYTLYLVDIPALFFRNSVYLDDNGQGFHDEAERNMAFQVAVLDWLAKSGISYDLVHCHDHQTGFIPFLMKHGDNFKSLRTTPSFYSIHNGAYNSRYSWSRQGLLPSFDPKYHSAIDWNNAIDALATSLRFADHVNTVSPSYLEEMKADVAPLRMFAKSEPTRFSGILNGIDEEVWDPRNDRLISHPLGKSWETFKKKNKKDILQGLFRTEDIPLMGFIGRFAYQKGGDLLVPAIERILSRFGFVNFYVLGSGDKHIEYLVQNIRDRFPERVACYIGYNETLAHKIYAASDFILMPSRFEPCGLNQLFAMRYGALPIARQTGGLRDTVVDFESDGCGVGFTYASTDDLTLAMARGLHLYKDQKRFRSIRLKASKLNYSWSRSAAEYVDKYNQISK